MEEKNVKKLRIYAMLMRLKEIQLEHKKRIALLEDERVETLLIIEIPPYAENYLYPKKIHPKHQSQNKHRFHR